MPFAPVYLFAGIKPARGRHGGRLHTLRIKTARRRMFMPSLFPARNQNAMFHESDTTCRPFATAENNDKQFAISGNPLAAFATRNL